ncbi:uncharacterized protein [Nicotiana tomentosiformis]|uniref:uncharacterized protein n=1 Tax=Nicotiana tomentosiformis TaxID=4098 RepID=UPI00388C871F
MFKLWYAGRVGGRNGVGILIDKDLRELVVKVRRVNDRLMTIKLVVGGFTLNIISVYAPQAGLDEQVKRPFWEDLDEMVRGIPHTEKLFIGGDFNGHIGATSGGMIIKLEFPEEEGALDYLLCRKSDRGLCMDRKVIPSENLLTLPRLLVMDLEITRKRRKRTMYNQHMIKWGALTEANAQELGVKLLTMGAWRSSGNARVMWITTTQCIREAARKVLASQRVTLVVPRETGGGMEMSKEK